MAILSLTPGELERIIKVIQPGFTDLVLDYDEHKYPADAYAALRRAFADPTKTSGGDIERALRWKYGHWHKLNYPEAHRQMARRVFARWEAFQSRGALDTEQTFEFWRSSLAGRTTEPFITVTFLLHLLRPHRVPIMDQNTFRAMNTLLTEVRPTWSGKKFPSTLSDLLIYTEFFDSLLAAWPDGPDKPSRGDLDRGLMVCGQKLKKAQKRSW